jgi:hypothetical protein
VLLLDHLSASLGTPKNDGARAVSAAMRHRSIGLTPVNATLPEDGPLPTAIHVRDYTVAIRRRSTNSYSSLTSWKIVCGESCLSKAYRSYGLPAP